MNRSSVLIFALLLPIVAAAGRDRPVIQPNEHYTKVGRAQAESDIRACSNLARPAGAKRADIGDMGNRDLFADTSRPDTEFRNLVERCLSNKGYNVIGWE